MCYRGAVEILIFDMYYHQVGPCQVCPNYAPGAKKALPQRPNVLHRLIIGKVFKNLLV